MAKNNFLDALEGKEEDVKDITDPNSLKKEDLASLAYRIDEWDSIKTDDGFVATSIIGESELKFTRRINMMTAETTYDIELFAQDGRKLLGNSGEHKGFTILEEQINQILFQDTLVELHGLLNHEPVKKKHETLTPKDVENLVTGIEDWHTEISYDSQMMYITELDTCKIRIRPCDRYFTIDIFNKETDDDNGQNAGEIFSHLYSPGKVAEMYEKVLPNIANHESIVDIIDSIEKNKDIDMTEKTLDLDTVIEFCCSQTGWKGVDSNYYLDFKHMKIGVFNNGLGIYSVDVHNRHHWDPSKNGDIFWFKGKSKNLKNLFHSIPSTLDPESAKTIRDVLKEKKKADNGESQAPIRYEEAIAFAERVEKWDILKHHCNSNPYFKGTIDGISVGVHKMSGKYWIEMDVADRFDHTNNDKLCQFTGKKKDLKNFYETTLRSNIDGKNRKKVREVVEKIVY